jgi:DNA-binding transcriptional ArsR family regulator
MSRRTAAARREERLDAVFHALSDTTRRRIVSLLARGPSSVGELAAPFSISLAAVSKHIDVLEAAGVVGRARDGRFQRCRLEPRALDEASTFIDHYRSFWEGTLDGLADYLEREGPPAKPARSRRTGRSARPAEKSSR